MSKLVRDRIPEIIPPSKSHFFRFSTLSEAEFGKHLKRKLLEEVDEYLETENVEELADIYEVLDAIIKFKQFELRQIHQKQAQKREQRGGFEKRILMEEIGK
jgi:predicted house-cleaning noncanonical NTP pyrophosphatase (MazG superfamily)